jgi:hypothetical protein
MGNRKFRRGMYAATVVALVLVASAALIADAHKTTYLTFSRSVSLPGAALASGTYTFQIANPDTSGDIVRVTSRDGLVVYFTGFTRPLARPREMSRHDSVSLGESAAGVPPPIMAWWPQNESTGREFVYPRSH